MMIKLSLKFMFKGSITALVSPFNNGKLDIECYEIAKSLNNLK